MPERRQMSMATTVPNNAVDMNMCSTYRNYVNSNVPWGICQMSHLWEVIYHFVS